MLACRPKLQFGLHRPLGKLERLKLATMKQIDLERKAEELLKRQGISHPPVRIENIARALGMQVAFEPFDGDLSGMLYREPGGATVVAVNSRNAHTRQRFTIAHEIGHFLLHDMNLQIDRPISVRFRDDRSGLAVDQSEIEANQFAAALLMPRKWIVDDVNNIVNQAPAISDDSVVEELTNRFRVSRQAMEFRLTNLGLWTPL
jgi:Zn-dependent peptidase ImmA (M78 family)